jgi:hypothetical protein
MYSWGLCWTRSEKLLDGWNPGHSLAWKLARGPAREPWSEPAPAWKLAREPCKSGTGLETGTGTGSGAMVGAGKLAREPCKSALAWKLARGPARGPCVSPFVSRRHAQPAATATATTTTTRRTTVQKVSEIIRINYFDPLFSLIPVRHHKTGTTRIVYSVLGTTQRAHHHLALFLVTVGVRFVSYYNATLLRLKAVPANIRSGK